MNTLRVEARFKNARLFNSISELCAPITNDPRAGTGGPVKSFCTIYDLDLGTVYNLLNLRCGPFIKDNKGAPRCVRPTAAKLAAVLEKDLAWLFPQDLYAMNWPKRAAVDVPYEYVSLKGVPVDRLLLPPSQGDEIAQEQCSAAVQSALVTLTPKEERVLKLRYGMDGEDEHTYEAIGAEFGVGGTRIRQIEEKALSKLRHPSRSRPLRQFLEADYTAL
jgi:RNA polymerase sigma factor (sigma-70 family)